MKKAEATRLQILQKAFELIYVKGYQATSIDDILATTLLTKGAFYYHFKNKDEMGMAIINELLKPILTSSFISPLQSGDHPLDSIYNLMHHLLMENDFLKVAYGCPVSNFAQEMAPWQRDFSKAINEITTQWADTLTKFLENAKKNGFIRQEIDAQQVTFFIMSGYWGIRNFGKLENNRNIYLPYLQELKRYLKSLE